MAFAFVAAVASVLFVGVSEPQAGSGAAAAKAPKRVALKCARLIDGAGGAPIAPATIVIEGDRITAVGSSVAIPEGAEVIELGAMTVLPGLVDCHTHLTFQMGEGGDYWKSLATFSTLDRAVLSPKHAKATLEAGFTTVRDVGAGDYVDVALRNAIDRGDLPGPRMQVATLGVGSTGGHFDESGLSPFLEFRGFSGIADGEAEIRKLIRDEIKHGADVIKISATAGVLSHEESVGAPQFTLAEMAAATSSRTTTSGSRCHRRATRCASNSANPSHSAVAAPVCPEGKLDVGGAGSRCGTWGRGRLTTSVVSRNTVDCMATPAHSRRVGSQRRHTARSSSPTSSAPTTIAPVFALHETQCVTSSSNGVRVSWSASTACCPSSASPAAGPASSRPAPTRTPYHRAAGTASSSATCRFMPRERGRAALAGQPASSAGARPRPGPRRAVRAAAGRLPA
jgi:hypothetical protein